MTFVVSTTIILRAIMTNAMSIIMAMITIIIIKATLMTVCHGHCRGQQAVVTVVSAQLVHMGGAQQSEPVEANGK
jgi:hypothetical protein